MSQRDLLGQKDLDDLSDSNLQYNIDIKLPQPVHHHFKHSSSHDSHHLEHKTTTPKIEEVEKVEPIPEVDPTTENDPANSQPDPTSG